MAFSFPKVYPILDASILPLTGRAEFLRRLGGSLAEAGVTLLEYRNKTGSPTTGLRRWGGKPGSPTTGLRRWGGREEQTRSCWPMPRFCAPRCQPDR